MQTVAMRATAMLVAFLASLSGCRNCDVSFCTPQQLCVCGLDDTPENRERMTRVVDVAMSQCGGGSLNGWSLEFQDAPQGVECDNALVPFDGSFPAAGCTDYSRKDIKVRREDTSGAPGSCFEHTSALHELCHALKGSEALHSPFHGSRAEATLCERWSEIGEGVAACDAQPIYRCYW